MKYKGISLLPLVTVAATEAEVGSAVQKQILDNAGEMRTQVPALESAGIRGRA
jgi:hypothetical protein